MILAKRNESRRANFFLSVLMLSIPPKTKVVVKKERGVVIFVFDLPYDFSTKGVRLVDDSEKHSCMTLGWRS